MSRLFTEDFFRNYSRTSLNESQQIELRSFSQTAAWSDSQKFDIFLSYNIADKAVVEGIYYYLSKLGYKVYLDSIIDPSLNRNSVTKQTAEKIHKRLKNSRSLIFAASKGASLSKWMTWELGVVDGNTSKCMLLPVAQGYETVFNKQEYLKLYPIICLSDFDGTKIVDEDGVKRDLQSVVSPSMR
ncbi:toll/interleukin-1 receptor domain-containing protein [Porphyromonas gingivalis]|uniref:toll/interleukin-1 receptor domain-containing protein n=1 Tax=Porphyromonas gingivalis TaxID=837 RepID=UPI00265AB806|nr:toll/interleukin-1 receptor domain-containing protein [Porphyromonas gingivalis]MDP0531948.1 toll/interleukin-1 receptor domain-containing protein [Porphyromonas gingivalis]MDP0624495.1 toll/interleukin-1 receptor domain-containing protein [Porphyromonas gingivalis]WKD53434.1 toll/interleukin-1 receptor domain-containing protein [Porphyromonas gingivalis]WKD55485.1 toll/interleukin-1 receptor domain-containing protein [Porphyromonas gingivalis]